MTNQVHEIKCSEGYKAGGRETKGVCETQKVRRQGRDRTEMMSVRGERVRARARAREDTVNNQASEEQELIVCVCFVCVCVWLMRWVAVRSGGS